MNLFFFRDLGSIFWKYYQKCIISVCYVKTLKQEGKVALLFTVIEG